MRGWGYLCSHEGNHQAGPEFQLEDRVLIEKALAGSKVVASLPGKERVRVGKSQGLGEESTTWLWVQNWETPTWLALVNGSMDQVPAVFWVFNFDPYSHATFPMSPVGEPDETPHLLVRRTGFKRPSPIFHAKEHRT